MKKKALYKKLGVKEGHKPGALLESLQAKGGAKALLKKHKHYKKHEKKEECAMCQKAHSKHMKHEKKSEKHEKKHGKNWIAGAIKKPGALHRELGVKAGNKIPASKLAHAAKKGGKEGKRARLAETLKSFHKTKGKHQKKHQKGVLQAIKKLQPLAPDLAQPKQRVVSNNARSMSLPGSMSTGSVGGFGGPRGAQPYSAGQGNAASTQQFAKKHSKKKKEGKKKR